MASVLKEIMKIKHHAFNIKVSKIHYLSMFVATELSDLILCHNYVQKLQLRRVQFQY